MKADILCETEGCPKEHDIINTVTFPMEEEDTFYEAFGHGGEEEADFCPECKRLGILQDPDLDDEEAKKFTRIAREIYGSDDVQFDEGEDDVSLTDDRKGVWVRGWLFVQIPENEEEEE
jgi:hypothetical protein